MPQPPNRPITQLIADLGNGDPAAAARLWTLLYDELRAIARGRLRHEPPGPTAKHATSIVHDAWLRFAANPDLRLDSRAHFFAIAARIMRQIVIDDARKKNRLKRGGSRRALPLDPDHAVLDRDPAEVLAVEDALAHLERIDPRKARLVTLRYFAGLTVEETAAALDISPRQVNKDWTFTRAWLHRQLSGEPPPDQT